MAAEGNAHPDLKVLAGGIAVVTGGASGIGFALAERSIMEGMHAVIADIDQGSIDAAVAQLEPRAKERNLQVFGHRVDVSDEAEVAELAGAVSNKFPDVPVSLLCCNAGVGGGGAVLGATDSDWDFVLGVNVKGVANCVRSFVPNMLAQDAAGSVVATSSQDGLCAAQGVYGVSKHACVALMEALHGEVAGELSVHVLCPNVVATNIVNSDRVRPARFGGPRVADGSAAAEHIAAIADRFKAMGMPPELCADYVFDAIRSGTFYILAEAPEDPGYVRLEVETRMRAILDGTRPYRPKSEYIGRVFDLGARPD